MDIFYKVYRICLIHFFISAFYGIAYFSTALSSNVYLNFILNGLVEIPMIIFCILTMDHIGRKPLIIFNLFLCGICCLPAGYTEASLKTALVLIGMSI